MKVEVDLDRLKDYIFKAWLDCRNCPAKDKECPFWKGKDTEISCEGRTLKWLKGEGNG